LKIYKKINLKQKFFFSKFSQTPIEMPLETPPTYLYLLLVPWLLMSGGNLSKLLVGGSLMVQICGSSSSSSVSGKDEVRSEKVDHLLVSDKQNDFSTSPVRVISKKDVPQILKK
jgi:hypothetical protein